MKRAFKQIRFNERATAALQRADEIIARYQQMGLRLTLRQLYYQFVAGGHITNEEKSYKWLGKVISDGRLAGELDWDAIEDRGRVPSIPSEWPGVDALVRSALAAYRLPRWADQPYYVELWVEKQALAGVLEPVAEKHHVPLVVNKGYSSSSAMYAAADRFIRRGRGKEKHLLYLGDHDPSGEDMVRDVGDRLALFGVSDLEVTKVALTWDQIQEFQPPPNPAKLTDSRAKKYVEEFGYESWEVDALPPDELVSLIEAEILPILDHEALAAVIAQEDRHKAALSRAAAAIEEDEA